MQMFAIVVSLAMTVGALVITTLAVRQMLGVIRSGQPAPGRTDHPGARAVTMLKESMLHTRMLQWHWIGIMHWFVYAAFLFLSSAVAAGFVQLFDPMFEIPVVGRWYLYGWLAEFLGLFGTLGIIGLIIYRQVKHPRTLGRKSRFFGSNFWQAYFVEGMVLLESAAILFIRGAEYKLHDGSATHFPLSHLVGEWFYPDSDQALKNIVYFVAMVKVTSAMLWLIVISRHLTMGIAWHRFTAWFNIYYKRESDGSTALGAMKPLTSAGKAITLDDIDDLDEDSVLGVGSIEDFSWKGILDFTTCTECGRCQSQCPAWNTEKPLSPKLLIMALRDHAYEKAGAKATAASSTSETTGGAVAVAEKSLIGSGMEDNWFYNPEDAGYVIDEDVLWSCTSCGACVQQCPVDIEHVDHIMDMRRYQVLVESNFPAELNGLFKGLENKGNPWNMSSTARMDWAKGLEFDVPVVGEDLESLDSVDWLFWVGCAGAYEDRAKKTTRAVAELLDMAGVSFGVLGNGETCTGDPARRAGNEFVFQGLAQQNVETFKEFKVKKVVSTCAHCFNTLKNEYKDFGIELEVVHHTQLLNRLVREGRLTPVTDGAGAAKRSITYHDPCFLGRHNQVYSPPRELLEILPGAEFKEMERNSEKSFCCGAGGARMWMEENIGERINLNRTKEAVGTGADQIAVGCPFCRVMLADGLTAEQAGGNAREEVEVLDVAQLLLASVKGVSATKAAPGSSAAASAGTPTASVATAEVATKAEPEPGDITVTADTITDPAEAGPAAQSSGGASGGVSGGAPGGASLFDTPAQDEAPAQAEKQPETKASPSGSLFDLGSDDSPAQKPAATQPAVDEAAEPASEAPAAAAPGADLGSGGSLFDLVEPAAAAKPVTKAEAEPAVESKAEAEPAVESKAEAEPAPAAATVGSTGSLFDIAAPDPVPSVTAAEPEPEPEPEAKATPASASAGVSIAATSIPDGGSLFDLEAPVPATAPAAAPAAETPKTAEPEPEPEPAVEAASEASAEAAPAEAPSGAVSTPATSIPEGGSLFDLEAPVPATAPVSANVEPEVQPEVQPEVTVEPTRVAPEVPVESPAEGLSAGAALSQAATFAAVDDDPDTILDADDSDDAEADADEAEAAPGETTEAVSEAVSEPDPQPSASPKPASGDVHTPKTDVDINASGSLFDL